MMFIVMNISNYTLCDFFSDYDLYNLVLFKTNIHSCNEETLINLTVQDPLHIFASILLSFIIIIFKNFNQITN